MSSDSFFNTTQYSILTTIATTTTDAATTSSAATVINEKTYVNNNNTTTKQQIQLNECQWAINYPELQKACYLSRICINTPPKCCRIKNIPSILQDGPTCGLTALSMLFCGQPKPNEILEMAKNRCYTYNGEMFSAKNLYHLVCDIAIGKATATTVVTKAKEIKSQNENSNNNNNGNADDDDVAAAAATATTSSAPIECQLFEGHLNCAKIKTELITNDACIFVPYDPDFNHRPCLKYGHKAHWALTIGYLIDADDCFYVICRHGKTRNMAVWPLHALSASNSNLIEFEQPKGYANMNFMVPDGGIGGKMGLKNQAIIVKGISTETIDIVL